jgi:hypothetical protein
MNPTDPTPDDSAWDSLAEELDVKPAARQPATPPADLPDAHDHDEDTVVVPALSEEPVADGDDAEGDGEGGDAGPAAEGETGEPGRKRRRRRRRRKKGGGAAEGGEAAAAEPAAAREEAGDEDEESVGEQGGGFVPAAAEEPPAELAREVIANWDVPSWDEIVAGLYRPGR